MEKINFYKEKKRRLTSSFFCSVMITMALMSFASCEKNDEGDSLVGTTWSTAIVNTTTGETGTSEFKITSTTMGVIRFWTDGQSVIHELTFSYYKDGDYWQMIDGDSNSLGRFTINGNTLFHHRINGTTLSYTKK